MRHENSLEKAEGRSQGSLINHAQNGRYNAALQLARQLNADKTQALKPHNALTIRQVLPIAVGVTSVVGTAIAGTVALAKVLRRIDRLRRAIQAKPAQESIQESQPAPIPQSESGQAIAVLNALEIRADPTHSALTVYSRTVVVHKTDTGRFVEHYSSERQK
jgi:hypothetical protein